MKKKEKIISIIGISISLILFITIIVMTSQTPFYSITEGINWNNNVTVDLSDRKNKVQKAENDNIYQVWKDGKMLKSFTLLDDALFYAQMYRNAEIINKKTGEKTATDIYKYKVYDSGNFIQYEKDFYDAIVVAKGLPDGYVYKISSDSIVWRRVTEFNQTIRLEVQHISQKPELEKGCEVTSLAMLLNYKGVKVDKMQLANEIEYDYTPITYINGTMQFGDPSKGFLLDMKDASKMGYGCNHEPIYRLLYSYIGDSTIDLTGLEFEDLYFFIQELDVPIWVLINTDLKKLEEKDFYTWKTPSGKTVKATNKEHAVLIVGFDSEYIYINDPLNPSRERVKKTDFIEAWDQMGKEAVTYLP